MAFTRRKTFSRRRPTTRRRRTRRVAKRPLDREIMRVINKQKQIKSIVNTYGPAPFDKSGSILSILNIPVQGINAYTNEETNPADAQRIGNTFYIKSLQLNMQINVGETSSVDVYQSCRLIIFQWMEDTSTEVPTVQDILMDAVSGLSQLSPINYNEHRTGKFKILWDKNFVVSSNANTAMIVKRVQLSGKKLPIKRLQTTTDSDFGVNGNIIKGKLFLLAVSDTTADAPALTWSARLNFTD